MAEIIPSEGAIATESRDLTKRVESVAITNVKEVKQKIQYYGYYLKIFPKTPLKGVGETGT